MLPPPTERLTFREMTADDFPLVASLLQDNEIMCFYPRPKSDDEVRGWISSTLGSYAEHGHGLWMLNLTEGGAFVGDCGLTRQLVDGEPVLEVGYRLLPHYQGKGHATEAALACVELAFGSMGATHVTAIINPANEPSRRVAERLGMALEKETVTAKGLPIAVYGMRRRA